MKRNFIYRLALFFLPLVLLVASLYLVPFDRSFSYLHKNNSDCNTSWIYHRLYECQAPVEIALLGTSHSGCGIDDQHVSKRLKGSLERGSFTNLAYCGGGRSIQLPIMKDLLVGNTPNMVIIELQNKNPIQHRDFSILANSTTLFAPPSFTKDYFTDLYNASKYRLIRLREDLFFGRKKEYDVGLDQDGQMINREKSLEFGARKELNRVTITINATSEYGFVDSFHDTVSQDLIDYHLSDPEKFDEDDYAWVEYMVEELKGRGIEVKFLYIPSFKNYYRDEIENSRYAQLGEVLYPPEELFIDQNIWVDHQHFNSVGAHKLSDWLGGYLRNKNNP